MNRYYFKRVDRFGNLVFLCGSMVEETRLRQRAGEFTKRDWIDWGKDAGWIKEEIRPPLEQTDWFKRVESD